MSSTWYWSFLMHDIYGQSVKMLDVKTYFVSKSKYQNMDQCLSLMKWHQHAILRLMIFLDFFLIVNSKSLTKCLVRIGTDRHTTIKCPWIFLDGHDHELSLFFIGFLDLCALLKRGSCMLYMGEYSFIFRDDPKGILNQNLSWRRKRKKNVDL